MQVKALAREGYAHPVPYTTVAAIVCACALAVLVFHVLLPSAARMTHGFISGYVASRLLLSGGFGPQVYDETWYIHEVQSQTGQGVEEIFSPNPPTFALLSLPLVWLSPQAGKAAWLWASLVFLGLGIWLAARVTLRRFTGLHLPALLLLAAFALVSGPVEANFTWGQSYVLVFLLLAAALWGAATGREALAGVCLGLALIWKANGALLLVPLLAYRRWRALAWSLGTALAVALAGLPWTGWAVWLAYPAAIRAFLAQPSVAVSAYQGLYGFLSHLLRYDPAWNPAPLANLPGLVQPLDLLLLVLSVAATLWAGRRAGFTALFAAFVALNVLFTPIAEEYHFAALLIPLFFLARELYLAETTAGPGLAAQAALAVTLLLLGLPMTLITPARADGWAALLAYPRLYAGILIWVLILIRMKQNNHRQIELPSFGQPPSLRGEAKKGAKILDGSISLALPLWAARIVTGRGYQMRDPHRRFFPPRPYGKPIFVRQPSIVREGVRGDSSLARGQYEHA